MSKSKQRQPRISKSELAYDAGYRDGKESGRNVAADFIQHQVNEARRAEAALFEERVMRVRNAMEQQMALHAAAHAAELEAERNRSQRFKAALTIINQQLVAVQTTIDALL